MVNIKKEHKYSQITYFPAPVKGREDTEFLDFLRHVTRFLNEPQRVVYQIIETDDHSYYVEWVHSDVYHKEVLGK